MLVAIDAFMQQLRSQRVSPHTLRNYYLDLQAFNKFIESQELSTISKETIRRFLVHMHEKKLARKTIARRVSTYRCFFDFCHRQAIVAHNPMLGICAPKLPQPIPKALTYEEIEIFLSAMDVSTFLGIRDRTIFELLYSSALRVAEVVALNVTDLSLLQRELKIIAKGDKPRIVFITPIAAQWLKTYLTHPEFPQTKHLFVNARAGRLTVRSIERLSIKYAQSSGLQAKVTPHVLRHTIATHWLEQGMNLKMIQQLLGHESLETTTIYTKVSMKLKEEIYRQSHPHA